MVMLVEEEWPFCNWQLRVKTNWEDDDSERRVRDGPGITKLITWGEEDEGSRIKETGDNESDARSMEGSSEDHITCPLDFRSILPITFNFDVGLILTIEELKIAPSETLNLNKGDSEVKITTSSTLSHFRLSPVFNSDQDNLNECVTNRQRCLRTNLCNWCN